MHGREVHRRGSRLKYECLEALDVALECLSLIYGYTHRVLPYIERRGYYARRAVPKNSGGYYVRRAVPKNSNTSGACTVCAEIVLFLELNSATI